VDYALAHLSALGAQVTFKPKDESTYGRREPHAVIRIKNAEETVYRSPAHADGDLNVLWLIEIGHKAFEMHIDLSNRGA
jgi:hypothetical protein